MDDPVKSSPVIEMESEDVMKNVIAAGIPQGGLLRARMKGGKSAARATMELHRRYFHEKPKKLMKVGTFIPI